jgi:hypothetical protein
MIFALSTYEPWLCGEGRTDTHRNSKRRCVMVRIASKIAQDEIRKALLEFHEGKLVVGNSSKVRVEHLRQALAIGRARARKKEAASPAPGADSLP